VPGVSVQEPAINVQKICPESIRRNNAMVYKKLSVQQILGGFAPYAAIVPTIEPLARDSIVQSLVRIRSSEETPPSPYRIQHRGYWFYIDDSDPDSKMFFETLVAAYSSRVGSKEAGDEKPQIVLPLGGG
jgi:hypothetical protein